MRKKLIAAAVLFVSVAVAAATGQGRYVRKQLQPDFFMPEKVRFNQPEKLPPLLKKEEFSQKAEEDVAKAAAQNTAVSESGKSIRIQAEKEAVPEFQTKFDDYNRDIDYISRSGEIPVNARLNADLEQMNSNELFRVTPKPYQQTVVSRAFNKALEEVLAEKPTAASAGK